MRDARTIGTAALLAVLLLGAPGCAAPGLASVPVATAGHEPTASVRAVAGAAATGAGLRREFMGFPRPGALLGFGALALLLSPLLVLCIVLWTPVRALRED